MNRFSEIKHFQHQGAQVWHGLQVEDDHKPQPQPCRAAHSDLMNGARTEGR